MHALKWSGPRWTRFTPHTFLARADALNISSTNYEGVNAAQHVDRRVVQNTVGLETRQIGASGGYRHEDCVGPRSPIPFSPFTRSRYRSLIRSPCKSSFLSASNRPALAVETARSGAALIGPVAESSGASGAIRVEHARTLMNLGFVLMRDRQNAMGMENFRYPRSE